MNQILATDNSNKRTSKNAIDIKKVIVFFGCALFLFGAVLIGAQVYKAYDRVKEEERLARPELLIEQVGEQVKISASYAAGIEKIVYYWNENEKTEIVENGKTKVQKGIDIPAGENTLVVQIIGVDGNKTEKTGKFGEPGESVIAIVFLKEEYQLKITATNALGLKHLKYQWNDDRAITVEPEVGSNMTIELIIDIDRLEIARGKNEITVTAVDANDRETSAKRTVEGRYEPEIEFIQYGDTVEVTIKHDMGFEKIEFVLNGVGQVYDSNSSGYDPTLTTVVYPIKLKPGENILFITAYSLENTEKMRGGRAVYEP